MKPTEPEHDRALLQTIADGDKDAFQQLYQRHSATLLSLSLRILGDRSDAEDVLQEAFVQVWKTARAFDPNRSAPIVWLIMMTRSRAIDRLRSRQAGVRAIEGAAQELPKDEPLPSQQASATEMHARVRNALESLPPDQRTPIELAFFKGLSQTEIAKQLQQPLGTVKTRIRTGMSRLRGELGALVGEERTP